MAELTVWERVEILSELRVVSAHLESIVPTFVNEGVKTEELIVVGLKTCGEKEFVREGLFTRFEGLIVTLLLSESFCEVMVQSGSRRVVGEKGAV